MKYLTFIRYAESLRELDPPQDLMVAVGEFIQQSLNRGVLLDSGGLMPIKDAVRVRLSAGRITVTDGRFMETREVIGGWAILETETETRAEAVRLTQEFMQFHRRFWPEFEGESECRPMYAPPGDSSSQS